MQGLQGNQGLFSNFPGWLEKIIINHIHTFPDFFIGAVEGDIICGKKPCKPCTWAATGWIGLTEGAPAETVQGATREVWSVDVMHGAAVTAMQGLQRNQGVFSNFRQRSEKNKV